jgi:protein tyrosine phosphatase (PTP) superfamily phosphohydrolase (DUF442 family)
MDDPETIYNWRRLDDWITTSGQPTEAQLADLHALGVRHIVNLGLHTHEKALPDEAGSVSRLGMTYIHIPVNFQNPTDQDFEKFCSVTYVETAMEILERIGARNDLARAILTRAALRQAAGDLTTARALLDQAGAIFHELGTLDEPARVEAARAVLDRGAAIPLLGSSLRQARNPDPSSSPSLP